MPIGTIGALLIGSAIAGGGQIVAGKMASNAAKNAAKTQADSGQRALNFEREQFEKALAAYAPFMAISQGATGKLADLLGVKRVGAGMTPNAAAATAGMGPPAQPSTPPMTMGAMNSPQTLYNAPAPQDYASTVLMQAPDGTKRRVRATDVPTWQARGAQLVTNSATGRAS